MARRRSAGDSSPPGPTTRPPTQPPSVLASVAALVVLFMVIAVADSVRHGTPLLSKERLLFVGIAAGVLALLGISVAISALRAKRSSVGGPFQEPTQRLHYAYAHRALPQILIGAAEVTLKVIEGGQDVNDPRGVVHSIWRGLAKDLGARGTAAPTASIETVGAKRVLLVAMPPEVGPTLAHFVAVVPEEETVRYFTLERDATDPEGSTVLGEWSARGHSNYGPGPAPRKAEFLEAVAGLARVDSPGD